MRRLVLLAVLLGCGRATYVSTGDVIAVDPAALQVTIRHEDIPGLMGAMTMPFHVRSADVLAGIAPGTRVRFELAGTGADLTVISLVALGAATNPRPGIHDHTPHHGGVVAMIGARHLEAVAARDGVLRVYLTDLWRRPVALDDTTGTVTVDLPEGRRDVPLAPRDGVLVGSGPVVTGSTVTAHVRVVEAGQTIESHFVLPLGPGTTGAAGVASTTCLAAERRPEDGARVPRCLLRFPRSVTFIAAVPGGARVLVGVLGNGVSVWRMPEATFVEGFAPPPPKAGPETEVPHLEAVNVIAPSPDGDAAAVAVENRVLVNAITGGGLLRELPDHAGVVRDLAWSPAAARLLLTVFYDAAAHVITAGDGRELRRLPVEREGAAVAFSPDGRRAAVGSDAGPVAIFELDSASPPHVLAGATRAATALLFAGDHLFAAGVDGTILLWDTTTGAIVARHELATSLYRAALAPGAALVAVGGLDGKIRLVDPRSGALVEEIDWHHSPVWGLGWAAALLVSGDGDGRVAVWDLADRLGVSGNEKGH